MLLSEVIARCRELHTSENKRMKIHSLKFHHVRKRLVENLRRQCSPVAPATCIKASFGAKNRERSCHVSRHRHPSCVVMAVAGREDRPLRLVTSRWVNRENADGGDRKRTSAKRRTSDVTGSDSDKTDADTSVFVSEDAVGALDAAEGGRHSAVDCRSSDRSDSTSPSGRDGREADESEDFQRTADAPRAESSRPSTGDWPRCFPVDLAARDSRYIRPQTKTTFDTEQQQTTPVSIESVPSLGDSLVRRSAF